MNILQLPLEEVHPYENNPRKNDNAVDAVAASIRQYGFLVPLVISADHEIITGHTRYKAAGRLGLPTVPCVIADELTDEQIKDIVVHILDHDEAKMDWWLLYLEVNTGLPDLSDYIFYPNLIGLDGDPSMEEIAEKIIEDRRQGVKIFL